MEEKGTNKDSAPQPVATPAEPQKKKSRLPLFLSLGILIVVVLGGIAFVTTNTLLKPQPKVYRIGVLVGTPTFAPAAELFKKEMTTLGYKEGENVVYDTKIVDNKPDEEKRVLQQFVQDKVDLIYVLPTRPSMAAKAATKGTDIPIVFGAAGIEGIDLVESVARPGGNITGIRIFSPDNTAKRLEVLHELAPKAKRINIIHSDYHTVPANLEALHKAAPTLGVTLIETKIANLEDLKRYFAEQAKLRTPSFDAILIVPEALMSSPPSIKVLSEFSKQHKIPVSITTQQADPGNILFGYTLSFEEVGASSALLANKILTGTPAGTIPVMSPNHELWLNYKAAQAMGLTVSDEVLSSAKIIIR